MNGFQNKKSACLIRLRHPVFLFPCSPNLLSKDFPESHKNMKTDIESLTNHVLDYDIRLLTISSIGPSLTFETIVSSFVTLYLIVSSLHFLCPLLYTYLLRIHFPILLLFL